MNLGALRRGCLAAFVCLMGWTCLWGCERSEGLPLIELGSLTPTEFEHGDELELRGAGFPSGRAAHVHFSGRVHRLGGPSEPVDIVVSGETRSTQRVVLGMSGLLEEALAGKAPVHSTFDGDVEVGFAAFSPEHPPVVARLRAISFDVVAPATKEERVRWRQVAESSLAAAGVEVTEVAKDAGDRCVEVRLVRAGSLADLAGVHPGDRLDRSDELHVSSVEDVAGAGQGKELTFVNAAAPGETRHVSLARAPSSLGTPALGVVALLLGLVSLVLFPVRAARRLDKLVSSLRISFPTSVGWSAIVALLLSSASRFDSDALVLGALSGSLFLFLHRREVGWRALVSRISQGLLFLGAMTVPLLTSGAIGIRDIALQQAREGWNVFRHPALFVLAVVQLFSLARSKGSFGELLDVLVAYGTAVLFFGGAGDLGSFAAVAGFFAKFVLLLTLRRSAPNPSSGFQLIWMLATVGSMAVLLVASPLGAAMFPEGLKVLLAASLVHMLARRWILSHPATLPRRMAADPFV